MSEDHAAGESSTVSQPASKPPTGAPGQHRPEAMAEQASRAARWLGQGETLAQGIVGLLLLLTVFFTLGYAVYDFFDQIITLSNGHGQATHLSASQIIAAAIINLVAELLLALIILEVLVTVLHFLREHTISLKPFLFIAIISAVRTILAISAQLTVSEVTGDEFWRLMVELGVSTGIILVLGLILRLLTKEAASDTP